jgi:DNA-binding response OmpR family regulator
MKPATVLIVEDSSYLAESLIDLLDMGGYNSIHANTGEQGVASAAAYEPDLILLDVRLPDIDGYEVYRRIRATDWGKSAKVMILTASESIENIAKNIDLPLEHVLFKPDWSMQDLLQKISDRLQS